MQKLQSVQLHYLQMQKQTDHHMLLLLLRDLSPFDMSMAQLKSKKMQLLNAALSGPLQPPSVGPIGSDCLG